MTAYVKENGIWKKSNLSSVKVDGEWKKTKQGFVKADGAWKRFYSSANSIVPGTEDTIVDFAVTQEMVDANPDVYILGEIWRAHTWTTGDAQTITIETSVYPWYVLVAGSGGKGGPDAGAGAGGGGSFVGPVSAEYLPEGELNFTVGNDIDTEIVINGVDLVAKKGNSGGTKSSGASGGSTTGSVDGLTAATGGTGGSYNAGAAPVGGFTSMINGQDLGYCGGGGAGGHGPNEYFNRLLPGGGGRNGGGNGGAGGNGNYPIGYPGGQGHRGGGGGGAGAYNNVQSGSSGIVTISYRLEEA